MSTAHSLKRSTSSWFRVYTQAACSPSSSSAVAGPLMSPGRSPSRLRRHTHLSRDPSGSRVASIRQHPSSLDAYLSSCPSQRTYSTKSDSSRWSDNQREDDSIFSPTANPWDHVFKDIKEKPIPVVQGPSARRQAMTARERNVFDDMFNMLFSAVSGSMNKRQDPSSSTAGIGQRSSAESSDLFEKLRSRSNRYYTTSEMEEELDRMKEAMELCNTDQQLLDWAVREVFGESQRYEEKARRMLDDPQGSKEPVELQPPTYPHLIALLMSTFRDRYADPHLALSIFEHARHLSTPSYVFGCTTPAYNELIETRWQCFRDLQGVCDALEEMRVNGIAMDGRTRSMAERIRREVGERNLWLEESKMGSGEIWDIVARIEQLTAIGGNRRETRDASKPSKRKKWSWTAEDWKGRALRDDGRDDGWGFNEWDDQVRDSRAHS